MVKFTNKPNEIKPVEVVHGQEFMMEFFDEDDGYDDEFLGRATVRTAAVADR